jgi:SAM-dependent methyltransferase
MGLEEVKRPEIGAGGYARDNTTVEFYVRINSLISETSSVLDLGAGRGVGLDEDLSFPRSLMRFKGRVARLSGCDVDGAVFENSHLDDAHLISNGLLPYDDATFDVIYSDWVIEHVEDVRMFTSEVFRVLKPGGWFCARTPNKWGYIALGATLVPSRIEERVLRKLQPSRESKDVFPKYYRLNTLGQVHSAFNDHIWTDCSYSCDATPAYTGGNSAIYSILDLFQALTPAAMNAVLMVFAQKKETARADH